MNGRIIRPGLELLSEPHSAPFQPLGVSVSARFIIDPSDLVFAICRCIFVLADIGNNIDRAGAVEHQSHVILG